MSLSMLRRNFKIQDAELGKVHKRPTIHFVPEDESTADLDKVKITLKVLPNATGGAKQTVTKNTIAKIKLGSPEELINWRIWLNYVIQNKPCKDAESRVDMVEMLLGGKALQHWRQFKSQATDLPILGYLDGSEESSEEEEGKERGMEK
eukprot:2192575-Ditylum_brightwellii.AAC.1